MKGFFTNLVDRHLGTCDTIQPRSLGRFETDHNNVPAASATNGTASGLTEDDQTLPTSAEFSIDDSPSVTKHKPEAIERTNDVPSLSHPDQNNASSKSALSEKHTAFFDSHVLPIKPQLTPSLDTDMQPNRGSVKPDQPENAAKMDTNKVIINSDLRNSYNKLHEEMRDNNPLPTSSIYEYILENDLNLRINAMLKRLTDDSLTLNTPPDRDNRSSQNNNETLMSILPETEISSLDPANASLELAPASNRQATREENRFTEDKYIALRHSQLEPPPWLSDMASQLQQRLLEKETKAEPVINVTIGRVEVRAVQTEISKSVRHTKKPTGVMTLDDYLKRREGRGSK